LEGWLERRGFQVQDRSEGRHYQDQFGFWATRSGYDVYLRFRWGPSRSAAEDELKKAAKALDEVGAQYEWGEGSMGYKYLRVQINKQIEQEALGPRAVADDEESEASA
jgi:hypothetical protein